MTIQNTTLNPADVATGGGTYAPILSNGNLTMTGQQSSNFAAIRTVGGISPGTWVWQVRVNRVGAFSPGIGIAATAQSLNAFGATGANWPGGLIWLDSGDVWLNASNNPGLFDSYTDGDLLSFAVNSTLGLIWGKVNDGAWNKSLTADPQPANGSAPVGGFSYLAALGSSVNPVLWMNNFNAFLGAGQVTCNFAFAPGLPVPNAFRWLIWAGVVPVPGGDGGVAQWSNGGDPAQGTGGLDFTSAAWDGVSGTSMPNPFFLTASGTGDGNIFMNPAPKATHAPKGFFPGWPGFNGWDPATAQGSAVPGINFSVGFPSTPGVIQSTGGLLYGKYYYEYVVGYDIFSQIVGVGVGRAGIGLNPWFNGASMTATNHQAGVQLAGGDIAHSYANGTLSTKALTGPGIGGGAAPSGTTIGVAVQLGGYIPLLYDPHRLQPVPMVCIPCKELLIGPGGFGGFGR